MNASTGSINQQDLDTLCEWQKKWLLTFNTIDQKCKVLPVDNSKIKRNADNINYYLNGTMLPVVYSEKDSSLKWDDHIQQNILKAKKCIGWVCRNVISREAAVMLNIYRALVRPHLEYCVQLWSPIPRHGNWSVIMDIESVRRMFTRMIDGVGLMPYCDRLEKLKLTTLIERRARGDLIEVFKIFKGIANYGENLFKFSCSGMNIVLSSSTTGKVNTFQLRLESG